MSRVYTGGRGTFFFTRAVHEKNAVLRERNVRAPATDGVYDDGTMRAESSREFHSPAANGIVDSSLAHFDCYKCNKWV